MIYKRRSTRGFTLLEILLVIMVIAIAAAAFLPVALNGVEQARTRSGLRQIISLNRYARTRAMLDRKPMALVYRTDADELQLLSLPMQRDMESETFFGATADATGEASAGQIEVVRTRRLPKFVRVRKVEGAEQEQDGYFVIFNRNGISSSQRIQVQDPAGEITVLEVNGLTGEIGFDD